MEEELPAPKDAISVCRFCAAGSKSGTVIHAFSISPEAFLLDQELGKHAVFHVYVCATHASHDGDAGHMAVTTTRYTIQEFTACMGFWMRKGVRVICV